MIKRAIFILLACVGFQSSAYAEPFSERDFYIGGGFSSNSLDGFDDATGYQIFGGMDLPFSWAGAKHTVELGYMDSGDFDFDAIFFGIPISTSVSASGIWGSYDLSWNVAKNVNLFTRLGFDAGDDDGIMYGAGAEFFFDAPVTLKVEIVKRENIDSLQFNVSYPL